MLIFFRLATAVVVAYVAVGGTSCSWGEWWESVGRRKVGFVSSEDDGSTDEKAEVFRSK